MIAAKRTRLMSSGASHEDMANWAFSWGLPLSGAPWAWNGSALFTKQAAQASLASIGMMEHALTAWRSWVDASQAAFVHGLQLTAAISSAVMVGTAVLAVFLLRNVNVGADAETQAEHEALCPPAQSGRQETEVAPGFERLSCSATKSQFTSLSRKDSTKRLRSF